MTVTSDRDRINRERQRERKKERNENETAERGPAGGKPTNGSMDDMDNDDDDDAKPLLYLPLRF